MEKLVKNLRKPIIGISILGLVILISSIVFVACNKDDEVKVVANQGIDYPIPENAEVVTELINIGSTVRLAQPHADYIAVGFSAHEYSLPHNIKNYNEYVKMIKSGCKNGTILKVTIGGKKEGYVGNLILKVEETDDLEEKAKLEVIYSSMTDAETGEPILKVDYLDPKAVEWVEALDREFEV